MIDPNHVLKVGAATDLYVGELRARNAELEKEVARLTPRALGYTQLSETELRQQLASAEEHNARLREALQAMVNSAADMKCGLKIADDALSLPASREALDKYVDEKVKELQTELETERLRLAACGVAALGYFNGCRDEYKSASLDDTLRLYAKYEDLTKQRDLAVSYLIRYRTEVPAGNQPHMICHLVDKFLSAIKESEV